ncbi:MAG: aerobic C4-dicarboxylate transport protein, partial [Pseudonocardiales bacterium]|nr:aerobic C4-dicarboxylate transport protein [Pseudonocardiales bacterium]
MGEMTVPSPAAKRPAMKQLWFWVLLAIASGSVYGLVAPDSALQAKWLADAFIQLIKTITAPVVFVTVIIGIASLGNLSRAGGLAGRALAYFMGATSVALALGLLAANIVKPGQGFSGTASADAKAAAAEQIKNAGESTGFVAFITEDILPTSFVQPFVDNVILQVLVLAILTAVAISTLPTDRRTQVLGVFDTLSRVVFSIIRMVMWVAPLGAFGGMAFTVAKFGGGALANLGALALTFWGTCAIFVFGVLGLVARASGFSIFKFVRLLKDELLIIVGTSSSEPVLPRLLAKLQVAGASRDSVGLTIPTGYSFNLDGTCIYLTLGALFIVQATGQDMSIAQQLALALVMIITSKGAAGITGAGLVTLTASLQAFGGEFFTAESVAVGIALVVGIDRIMSEGRALTNCIGNGVATLVIARWSGELDQRRLHYALDNPRWAEAETELMLAGADLSELPSPEDATRNGSGRFEGGSILPGGLTHLPVTPAAAAEGHTLEYHFGGKTY